MQNLKEKKVSQQFGLNDSSALVIVNNDKGLVAELHTTPMETRLFIDREGFQYKATEDSLSPIPSEEIERALLWLNSCKEHRALLNEQCSYGLKHRAEYWYKKAFKLEDSRFKKSGLYFTSYVSNGAMIMALYFAGFTVYAFEGDKNGTAVVAGAMINE